LHRRKSQPQDPIVPDQTVYRQRHKIAKRNDWRRIHTSYDRGAPTFFSAIGIAATIIFWINQ
jgi:transposase